MDAVLLAIAGVPWQHWAILAAASWIFALVCFIGYSRPRSRKRSAAPVAYLQLVRHRPPDDLQVEHDRLYRRRRAA